MRKTIVRIGDIGRVITGSTPSKSQPDFYGKYALWIKPTDIKEGEKYTTVVEEMFSKKAADENISRLVPANSICVPCIGTVGTKISMTPCDCFVNQSINAIVPNEHFDNDYVYYLLLNFLPDLKSFNKGTASGREYIAKTAFEAIEIEAIADVKNQSKIGKILSNYDNLIDNCRKQIALLEEAAKRLYREWFVNFRFPGHVSTPIIDGLPQGWRRSNVNAEMTFQRGYDLPQKSFNKGKIPVVGSTTIIGYHSISKMIGPGIVTGRSGSLGKFQFIDCDYWPHNTTLFLKDLKEHSIYFLHQLLLTLDFSTLNSGGAIPSLNRNVLSNLQIVIPDNKTEFEFEELVKPLYRKISILSSQISLLLNTRDMLLPRLMSGEIDVNEISVAYPWNAVCKYSLHTDETSNDTRLSATVRKSRTV